MQSPDNFTVAGLFCYPVKSFRAISLDHANFVATGIKHDREWMLVDARATPHRFITQRERPELATITVSSSDESITFSHPSHPSLTVSAAIAANAISRVKVWGSEVVALDAGDAAAAWIGDVLGESKPVYRLVKFHPQQKRECSTRYAGDSGAHTMFADGYPVLVANEASLADLNQRMRRDAANAMPMNRFRPNVVLAGLPAWDEDHIESVAIGSVELKLVKPCVRCEITTTNQDTGARLSDEPLATLARFRNNPDLGGVTFGWNAIVTRAGTVTLGDRVVVTYRF